MKGNLNSVLHFLHIALNFSGGPVFTSTFVFSSVMVVLFWAMISFSASSSSWATNVMAVPAAFILAVLPILWKYAVVSVGML